MARAVRAAGIGVELYPEPKKVGAQLQFAEKRGFKIALIAGPDEFAHGVWKVKDLAKREEKYGGRDGGKRYTPGIAEPFCRVMKTNLTTESQRTKRGKKVNTIKLAAWTNARAFDRVCLCVLCDSVVSFFDGETGMDRSNPYEAAFEGYLQHHGLCTVAVDETRRALWGVTPIKSLDFIVLGQAGTRLLVEHQRAAAFPAARPAASAMCGKTGPRKKTWPA